MFALTEDLCKHKIIPQCVNNTSYSASPYIKNKYEGALHQKHLLPLISGGLIVGKNNYYFDCSTLAHLRNKKKTLSVCIPPSQHVSDEHLYYNHLDSHQDTLPIVR